jgi:glycosyltransferase involved in cell wall biosynthesis
MSTIKIYDCSNSEERPIHRKSSLCPFMNDICSDLMEYVAKEKSEQFEYVIDPVDADVIFTNDVYPQSILDLGKPTVKRMDGVFWQKEFQDRNKKYLQAAYNSSKIIFISKYSQECFYNLYHCLYNLYPFCDFKSKSKVILNDAPEDIFYPRWGRFCLPKPIHQITFAACVSNWERKEKRFNDLIKFAKICSNIKDIDIYIKLIGECSHKLPSNVWANGYCENRKDIADILRVSDAFINLSFKDAAPKTVCQAIRCGLPVLYANSGGVGEIVGEYGVPIFDNEKEFQAVYELKEKDIYLSLNSFIEKIYVLQESLLVKQDPFQKEFISYKKTLDNYLSVFSEVA